MSFADQVAQWQVFFATVAALSGTLVGLLFVALGLTPRLMATTGPSGCASWPPRPSTTS